MSLKTFADHKCYIEQCSSDRVYNYKIINSLPHNPDLTLSQTRNLILFQT